MSTLQGIILAQRTLQTTGEKYALTGGIVRILGAVSVLSERGARATYGSVQQLLGMKERSTVDAATAVLVRRGFMTRERGEGIVAGASTSLRITAAGQIVLSTLARVEREVMAEARGVEVGTWKKRKYIRSGKFAKPQPPAL